MYRPQDDLVPLHEPFDTAVRGFNRQQVLAHIESLDGRISMLLADRESVLAQVAELSRTLDHLRKESELLVHLRHEVEKAKAQFAHIHQTPIAGASVRIQHIIKLAEEEAAELKARAAQEAAELKARATSEAAALLRETTRRCRQLTEESERCRQAAEQATVRELARREAEANARIQRRDERGIAGLYLIVQTIGQRLTEQICAAEQKHAQLAELCVQTSRQVSTLEAFRVKITTQLADTRQTLARALEQARRTEVDPPEPELAQPVPIQRDGPAVTAQATGNASVQLRVTPGDERRYPIAPG